MVFGKSKFDKQQDKWLQALWKNQQVLIKNNDFFIKDGKTQWQYINKLTADNKALLNRIAALESTIIAMKQKDKEFASRFNQIANLMSSAAKTKTETVEAQVKT